MRTLHCKFVFTIIVTIVIVTITVTVRRDCIADMVPVDICINLLVCVAWQTAKQAKGAPIKVYNCTSGGINPITWGQVVPFPVLDVTTVFPHTNENFIMIFDNFRWKFGAWMPF